MNNADYYKNLAAEIKRVAGAWGREFPTINKISLYQAFRPPNKYIILVESFNPTELNHIAESLSFKRFEKYVKESPDYLPFFSQAFEKIPNGNLDEKVPVEFQQRFLKYAFDQFLKYWRTLIQHEFKRDLNEAYTTSERNPPIWIFHLEIPGQELPEGFYQDSEEIYQDSSFLIYERKNVSITALNAQPVKRPRHSQRCKFECQKRAEKIWQLEPEITIADMINREELLEFTKKNNGKFYSENTIRDWIKHKCPNRLPGRRPKKAI